jgi:hypothetical protein
VSRLVLEPIRTMKIGPTTGRLSWATKDIDNVTVTATEVSSRTLEKSALRALVAPFSFGAIFAGAAYLSAGASLGLFLGGLVFVAVAVPAVTLASDDALRRAVALAAAIGGVAAVELIAVGAGTASFGEWIEATLVLASLSAATAGVTIAIHRFVRSPVAAAAMTVVLGIAWLTWPIWRPTWSVWPARVQPLLVINSAMSRSPNWTELPIAYRHLTAINQDTPVGLPTSPWGCVITHLFAGGVLLIAGSWLSSDPVAEL